MLFRLKNIAATYYEIVKNKFHQFFNIFIIVYLNNIVVYSRKYEKYVKYINLILKYLNQRNLCINLEKYKFHKGELNFLGFMVRLIGIWINSGKIQAIKD